MSKLSAISEVFNSLTGINARHNKALRDVADWADNLRAFLLKYNLTVAGPELDDLLANIGEAKVELITLTHRGNPLLRTAGNVRGSNIAHLLAEILSDLETVKRLLISPALQSAKLGEVLASLSRSFENLADAISSAEYR